MGEMLLIFLLVINFEFDNFVTLLLKVLQTLIDLA